MLYRNIDPSAVGASALVSALRGTDESNLDILCADQDGLFAAWSLDAMKKPCAVMADIAAVKSRMDGLGASMVEIGASVAEAGAVADGRHRETERAQEEIHENIDKAGDVAIQAATIAPRGGMAQAKQAIYRIKALHGQD